MLCVVDVLNVVGEMNVLWVLGGVVDLCLPCLRDGARLTRRGGCREYCSRRKATVLRCVGRGEWGRVGLGDLQTRDSP